MNIIQIIVRIGLSVIGLSVFILFLNIVWSGEINLPKFIRSKIENNLPVTSVPITISPRKVILKTGKWKGTSSFNIYNNSLESLYDIYIKIKIESSGINSSDIKITPKNETDFIKGEIHDILINFDHVQIMGRDSKGKECVLMIIYSLLPHESKPFKIDANKVLDSGLEQASILIDLVKYSKEPVQVLSQSKGEVAFPVKLNESFTVKGVSFYIKKKP